MEKYFTSHERVVYGCAIGQKGGVGGKTPQSVSSHIPGLILQNEHELGFVVSKLGSRVESLVGSNLVCSMYCIPMVLKPCQA